MDINGRLGHDHGLTQGSTEMHKYLIALAKELVPVTVIGHQKAANTCLCRTVSLCCQHNRKL